MLGGLGMIKEPSPSGTPAFRMLGPYSTILTWLWEWRWPSVSCSLGPFDGRDSYGWRNDVVMYATMPSTFSFFWVNCDSDHVQHTFIHRSEAWVAMLTTNREYYSLTNATDLYRSSILRVLGGLLLNGSGLKRLRITAFAGECLRMCRDIKSNLYSLIITQIP